MKKVLMMLAIGIIPIIAMANDSLNVAIIGQIPVTAIDFDVYNDTMFCVNSGEGGWTGRFYDVSNINHPDTIGQVEISYSGMPSCQLIDGSTAITIQYDFMEYGNERQVYHMLNWDVAAWNLRSGEVFEYRHQLSNREGGFEISPNISNVASSAGIVYTSSEEFGSIGYDLVSNQRVNNAVTSLNADFYAADDTILIAIDGGYTRVYDISNRENPTLTYEIAGWRWYPHRINGGFASLYYGDGTDSIAGEIYAIGQDTILTRCQIVIPECLRGESLQRNLFWLHDRLFVVVWDFGGEEARSGLAYYNLEDLNNPRLEGYYQGINITKLCALNSGRLLAQIPGDNRIFELAIGDDARAVDSDVLYPQEFSLVAYPNPFNSTLSIAFEGNRSQNSTVSIFDQSGRLQLERILAPNVNSTTWEASGVSAGTYFVHLNTANGSVVQPVVLVK